MCKLEYIILIAGYKSKTLYQMQINIKYETEYTEEKKTPEICDLVSIRHFWQIKSYETIMIKSAKQEHKHNRKKDVYERDMYTK